MRMSTARPLIHRSVAAAFGGVLLVGGVSACSDSAGPDEGTTVEDVVEDGETYELDEESQAVFDDIDSFTDQSVTVSAQVSEVISDQAFVLEADGQGLLVVGAESLSVTPEPDVIAQVNGVVQTFVLVDVEESLGADLDDDSFADYEEQHYIVADNVDLLSGEDS